MDELVLDHSRITHLAGLESIRNGAPDAGRLQGAVTVVNFFASWCPPCGPEAEILTDLFGDWDDRDVQFVSVNLFEDLGGVSNPGRLERFLNRYEPPFSVVRGNDDTKTLFGGVDRIPTLFVFGQAGEVVFRFVHERDAEIMSAERDEIEAAIVQATAQSSS